MGLSGARRCRMHYQQGSQQLNAVTALGRFAHSRSATGPAARQRPRPGAEIAGGEVSRVMLHELEHPCPPTIISKSGLNVCFWHKSDIATRISPRITVFAGCGRRFGGEIYVDANSNLSHQGERLYTGDFGATLRAALSTAVGAPKGLHMRIAGLEHLKPNP